MKYIICLGALFLLMRLSVAKYEGFPAVADIIFVIDASESEESFKTGLKFAADITNFFKLGPDDARFGAVIFSDDAQKLFDLKDYNKHSDLYFVYKDQSFLGGSTQTQKALQLIADEGMFDAASGGRETADDIVIVLLAQDSEDNELTFAAADSLKDQGVSIIAVNVGFKDSYDLAGLASRPDYVFYEPGTDVLATLLNKLLSEGCSGVKPQCDPDSCAHFCTETDEGIKCSCDDGFVVNPTDPTKCDAEERCKNDSCEQLCIETNEGIRCSCEEGYVVNPLDFTKCDEIDTCSAKADILLMFDSSSSIGLYNYEKQFEFAKRLIRHFDIGPDDVRFAAFIFSLKTEKLFDLNDYNDYASLDEALTDVKYLNSSTYTHTALMWVSWNNTFNTGNGGRDDASDIIVLITDGDANRQKETVQQATKLKSQGITILAIAIGPEITKSKLEQVVSSPEDIVTATDFDQLDYIEKRVADLACPDLE